MEPRRLSGVVCCVSRQADRRRAVVRLVLLGLAIGAAFAAVTVAGIGPGDARRWVGDAGPAAPVMFVLAGGVLGLTLFPGHVFATIAGLLFGAAAGTGLAPAAAVLGAGLCMLAARRLGADAVLSLLGPRALRWREWVFFPRVCAPAPARAGPG